MVYFCLQSLDGEMEHTPALYTLFERKRLGRLILKKTGESEIDAALGLK